MTRMTMTMTNLYVITAPLLLIVGDQLEHPDDLANLNKTILMMMMIMMTMMMMTKMMTMMMTMMMTSSVILAAR